MLVCCFGRMIVRLGWVFRVCLLLLRWFCGMVSGFGLMHFGLGLIAVAVLGCLGRYLGYGGLRRACLVTLFVMVCAWVIALISVFGCMWIC